MQEANPPRRTRRADPLDPFDRFVDAHRLEEVRLPLRRELRTHQGQRALSGEIGVGRAVIRKLVEMRSAPLPEHLRAIRGWLDDRPPLPAPPEATCLAILAGGLPAHARVQARRVLADALRDAYAGAGCPSPAWLEFEIADAA